MIFWSSHHQPSVKLANLLWWSAFRLVTRKINSFFKYFFKENSLERSRDEKRGSHIFVTAFRCCCCQLRSLFPLFSLLLSKRSRSNIRSPAVCCYGAPIRLFLLYPEVGTTLFDWFRATRFDVRSQKSPHSYRFIAPKRHRAGIWKIESSAVTWRAYIPYDDAISSPDKNFPPSPFKQ